MGAAVLRMFAPRGRDETGAPTKRARTEADADAEADTVTVNICVGHRGIRFGIPAEHDPHLHPVQMQLEFQDNPDPSTGRHIHRLVLPLDYTVRRATAGPGNTSLVFDVAQNNEFKKFLWHVLQPEVPGKARPSLHLVFRPQARFANDTQTEDVYFCAHRVSEPGREDRVWFAVHSLDQRTLTSPALEAAEAAGTASGLAEAAVPVIPGVPISLQLELGGTLTRGWEEPYVALNIDTPDLPRWHCRGVLTFGVNRAAHPDRHDLVGAVTGAGAGAGAGAEGRPFWPQDASIAHGSQLSAYGIRFDSFNDTMVAMFDATEMDAESVLVQLLLDAMAGRHAQQVFSRVTLSTNMRLLCGVAALWPACFPDSVDIAPLTMNGSTCPYLLKEVLKVGSKLKCVENIIRRLVAVPLPPYLKTLLVNTVYSSKGSPLMLAADNGNAVAVWTLLSIGADPTAMDTRRGETPFRAFLRGVRFEVPAWFTQDPVGVFLAFTALAPDPDALFKPSDPPGLTLVRLLSEPGRPVPPEVVLQAARGWDARVGRWNSMRAAWVGSVGKVNAEKLRLGGVRATAVVASDSECECVCECDAEEEAACGCTCSCKK